ncbi:MAG TPA: hypothetical protein VEA41_23050 [Salinarimonas sp.]|nr:hypothetical protein [Salinarimonas sp.]
MVSIFMSMRRLAEKLGDLAKADVQAVGERTAAMAAIAVRAQIAQVRPIGYGALPIGRAAGLAARQARAKGRVADLAPIIAKIRATGATSLGKIAAELNARCLRVARGGPWSAVQVSRLLTTLPAAA